ncbi:Ammonium transporter [Oxytricha trifallax]|uniref:Ammonium transporter n=1 Tax=Oxytricha trifallax TaxID=1172189 RepID=A0A073HZI8_9SPIT|nr:Ammonium transporter [Oxytricha trifallax]
MSQKQRNQSPSNKFKKQKKAVHILSKAQNQYIIYTIFHNVITLITNNSLSEVDATYEGELSQDSASINSSNNNGDNEITYVNHSMSRHYVGLTGNDNFITPNQVGGNAKPQNSFLRKSGAGGNSNRVSQVNNFGGGGLSCRVGGGLNSGIGGNNQNNESKQLISELSGMFIFNILKLQNKLVTSAQHSKKPTYQSKLNTNNFGFGHSRTNTNTISQRR